MAAAGGGGAPPIDFSNPWQVLMAVALIIAVCYGIYRMFA